MKKFILHIILFFALVAGVDVLFGFTVDGLFARAKGGEKAKLYYLGNKLNEDVVIMGSSRAYRHFNPQILEDSLSLSVYNAGCSSMGIICNYGFYKLFAKEHKPKLIIYEVYDLDFVKDDYSMYLSNLRPFRSDPVLRDYIALFEPTDRYKMMSSLYSYNTNWVYIVQENIKPSMSLYKGYQPYLGEMKQDPVKGEWNHELDSLKYELMKSFVLDCKKDSIDVLLSISPYYWGKCEWLGWTKTLSKECDVDLVDFSEEEYFLNNKTMFVDPYHLNQRGSDLFSSRVSNRIRGYLQSERTD